MVYSCNICCENNYPVLLECSHTICDQCIQHLIPLKCPQCRQEIGFDNVRPNSDYIDETNLPTRDDDFWQQLFVHGLVARITSDLTDSILGTYIQLGVGIGEVTHLLVYISDYVDSTINAHRVNSDSIDHYVGFDKTLFPSLEALYVINDDISLDDNIVRKFIIKLVKVKINDELDLYLDV